MYGDGRRCGRIRPRRSVTGKDALALIAPADTAIGLASPTARRLVAAAVSTNTRRAYAGAQGAESRGSSGPVRSTWGGSGVSCRPNPGGGQW